MALKVLVTGGLGFIGSHTVVELVRLGYETVIADNLSNSEGFILDRIETITGKRPAFYSIDLCDMLSTRKMFEEEKHFDFVIHFAALKAVNESVKIPLEYFNNNLVSLLNLLHCMESYQCRNFVFSSSATVYGDPDEIPIKETAPLKKSLSAYASTKQIGEEILQKVSETGKIKAIILRYFNPVGAHESALIGELPIGIPNNIMPVITQTAVGKHRQFTVYGNDYDTPDGSCIRDYIHVVDLAVAHIRACERLIDERNKHHCEIYNVGTGKGVSVFELIKAFEEVNHVKLNYKIGERRKGDAPVLCADVSKANKFLNWKAEKNLADMVRDSWKWEVELKKK
jgi:UDP-glucose 4-epimerase